MNKPIHRNNPVRVLHIITRLVNGGADENTISTVRGLMENGYEVDLVIGGDSDFDLVQNVQDIEFVLINELRRDIRIRSNLVALWKLFRLIRKKRYEIVHTHTAMAGFLGRLASKLAGVPIVIHTLHGITFHDFLNLFTRKFYVLCEYLANFCTDCYIAVGEDIKQRYLSIPIGHPQKYTTIRSGFDCDEFLEARTRSTELRKVLIRELDLDRNDIIVGMVARLEPRKGHIYILEAIKEIVREIQKCRFVIVGEGYYKEQIVMQAERLGIGHYLNFIGHRDDIAEVMAAFDIFVLTSLWEGLPRVIVQAALLGKPIVTFDVEGVREVVKEGINGFVVPPRDAHMLSRRLLYLMKNLSHARMMGRRGINLVETSWDKDLMIRQTVHVYDNLLKNRIPGGAIKSILTKKNKKRADLLDMNRL